MNDSLLNEGNKMLAEKGLAFAEPAAGAASSARRTRDYFDSLQVEFRMIDAVEASTAMELYGHGFETPVMVAALSRLGALFDDGMNKVARAAAATGAVMWCGIGDEDELKAMIDTGAKTVKIVKPYRDNDLVFTKIAQAERCGAFATGMDIDFFFGRDNGSAPVPMAPKTLDDIKSYVKATKLPFILKGVLSEKDAAKALEAGAGGIVVSHHGGVVMDCAVSPLRILPRIAEVIGGRIPIFVDCGVIRGLDAFKALALGANAVSVGKAVMAGLAAGGEDGARKVLEGITWELRRAMSLTGARDLRGIDATAVWGAEK